MDRQSSKGDITQLSLREAGDALRRGTTSPVELTKACLDRITLLNPAVNAFITVTGDAALERAREMEAEQQRGVWRGPLHGIPLALKDNIDTAGVLTSGASELFKDRVPAEDAHVVRRLEQAGAVFLGKLNLHELACGGTSDVTYYGAVRNPWSLDHITGGSSGGSAAACAAGMCFGALGTDTAGSVRLPASHCGVVGLKPTYGRVSIRGIIPLAWSLDHCGPIARTVEDCALMLQAMAGYDPLDPTTVDAPVPDYASAIGADPSGFRLSLPATDFFEDLDPEVTTAMEAALAVLRRLTGGMTEIPLPPMPRSLGFSIIDAEDNAYHAAWLAASPQSYQPLTRERFSHGAGMPASVYVEALRRVQLLRREIASRLSATDLIITPTVRRPAVALADVDTFDAFGPLNTLPFNVLGLPTISVPCGFSRSGLPIGLQITGAPFAEKAVLALAHAYEQATGWQRRRPPLAA